MGQSIRDIANRNTQVSFMSKKDVKNTLKDFKKGGYSTETLGDFSFRAYQGEDLVFTAIAVRSTLCSIWYNTEVIKFPD